MQDPSLTSLGGAAKLIQFFDVTAMKRLTNMADYQGPTKPRAHTSCYAKGTHRCIPRFLPSFHWSVA